MLSLQCCFQHAQKLENAIHDMVLQRLPCKRISFPVVVQCFSENLCVVGRQPNLYFCTILPGGKA